MILKITSSIVIILLIIFILISPSSLLKGVGHIEWKLLNNKTTELYKEKNFDKALLVAKHALKVGEEKLGVDHLRVAKSLNHIGLIDKEKGNYDEAITANLRALKIQKKKLDPNNLRIANTMNILGESYLHIKDYANAKKYLISAFKIKQKKLDDNSPSLATSYNNLGALYHYQGDYNKAIVYHKRSLTMRKKNAKGRYNSSVNLSLHNLAEAYMKSEKYKDALAIKKELLKTLEKKADVDSKYIKMDSLLHDLGWLYYNRGNYQKKHRDSDYKRAESYYLRALALREKGLKDNNSAKLLSTLENLTSLYRKTKQENKAKDFGRRIEKLQTKDKKSLRSKTSKKEKITMSNKNNDLIPYFIPSLSATLLAAEKEKGSPLRKQQVINIRDNSTTIVTPKKMIEALNEKRGYKDIDPEHCWSEWLQLRPSLGLDPIAN